MKCDQSVNCEQSFSNLSIFNSKGLKLETVDTPFHSIWFASKKSFKSYETCKFSPPSSSCAGISAIELQRPTKLSKASVQSKFHPTLHCLLKIRRKKTNHQDRRDRSENQIKNKIKTLLSKIQTKISSNLNLCIF